MEGNPYRSPESEQESRAVCHTRRPAGAFSLGWLWLAAVSMPFAGWYIFWSGSSLIFESPFRAPVMYMGAGLMVGSPVVAASAAGIWLYRFLNW